MEGKTPKESESQQVQLLMPEHINGRQRLFGGRLMEWIDTIGGITARRHAGTQAITASVDTLEFIAPAYINSTVILNAKVTYVGRTSMEVKVETFAEDLAREKYLINRAYLVYVAIDESDKPVAVPPLIPETDEEKLDFENGKKRSELRRQRRKEKY